MSDSDNAPIQLAQGFRFQYEPAQESWVLLYPEGMVKLNGPAAEIMKLIDGSSTEDEIIERLLAEFPGADLGDDVRDFIREARSRGWLSE